MVLRQSITLIIPFIPLILVAFYFFIDFSDYFFKDLNSNIQISSSLRTNRSISQIGEIQKYEFQLASDQLQVPSFPELEASQLLSFNKKIDKYIFTHYNWYRFQINLQDLEYDSSIQFKMSTQTTGTIQFTQKVGFQLNQYFYPTKKRQNHLQNQGLKVNFQGNGTRFKVNINQYTVKQMKNLHHDGHIYQSFNRFSPFQNTTQQQINTFFRTSKTITTFNISYERQEIKLELNLTHVLRHDQCSTHFNSIKNVLRHKCLGGYGYGRIQMDTFQIDNSQRSPQDQETYGNWTKDVFNVQRTRTRTIFSGVRSTRELYYKYNNFSLVTFLPKTCWKWVQLSIDFNGFNKNQYYQKKDNIQKQRWIGFSIHNDFSDNQTSYYHQYLFINGKILPIHDLSYEFNLNDQFLKDQIITFRSLPAQSAQDINQIQGSQIGLAYVYFQFKILSSKLKQVKEFGKTLRKISIEGFWSGSIYAQTSWPQPQRQVQVQRQDFYDIIGTIQIVQGVY